MEPVYYTVKTINGDYAYMTSDSGVENQVAMFLLPEFQHFSASVRLYNRI